MRIENGLELERFHGQALPVPLMWVKPKAAHRGFFQWQMLATSVSNDMSAPA